MGGDQIDGAISFKIGTVTDVVLRGPITETMSAAAWKKAFAEWLEDQADIAAAKRSLKNQAKPGARTYTLEKVRKQCGL